MQHDGSSPSLLSSLLWDFSDVTKHCHGNFLSTHTRYLDGWSVWSDLLLRMWGIDVLLHFIFYMEIQLFQHRWLKRLFSTELSIHLCQKSMDDWKLQINILYTWNLNNIVQRLYLDFKKISGRYMSGSLFGLYVLFCMLCTDPYFYIFTKTTLSWWFIIIVSLEIRQHDSLICSLFPKSDLLFSYFVFIHIFYNKIVSLYPQDPVGVLIWIVSKLGWVLKQSISQEY